MDLKEKKLNFYIIHSNIGTDKDLFMNLFQFVVQDYYFLDGIWVFKKIHLIPIWGGEGFAVQF